MSTTHTTGRNTGRITGPSTGAALAEALGYAPDLIAPLPAESVRRFAGVGNPFALAPIPTGSRVVVMDAGAGLDCFIAARLVGPQGWVVGVEPVHEHLRVARQAAAGHGVANIDLCEGNPERMPVEDGWADVVIGNGALRHGVDRSRALHELGRVLRPGGALQLAVAVPRAGVDRWCEALAAAGFSSIAVGLPTSAADIPPSHTFRARKL